MAASAKSTENSSKDGPIEKGGGFRMRRILRLREPPIPETRHPNPEARAGFLSLLTFTWMSSIMATGFRRPLKLNDIWLLHPERRSQDLASKLKANFQDQHQKGNTRPLSRAIFKTFQIDLIIGALAAFITAMVQVLVPFVVRYIVAFAVKDWESRQSGAPAPYIGRGVGLVLGVAAMQVLGSIGYNHFFYRGMLTGGQVRAALISMIFDKAMVISGRAKAGGTLEASLSNLKAGSKAEAEFLKQQLAKSGSKASDGTPPEAWNNGRINNLMSVDTSRIDQACGWLHMGWTAPLSLIVTTILLLVNLSYSALSGLGLFFTATPVIAYIIRAIMEGRRKINKITDERISITQEVLQAIRFVKYYAWESDFVNRLDAVREKEIRGIRFLLSHRNAAIAMGSAVPVFSSMLAFITYSLTSHSLDPALIFSSLAMFNQLRLPLLMFPMVMGLVTDALQSLARIEQFLLAEEQPVPVIEQARDVALNLRDACFTWEHSGAAVGSEESSQSSKKEQHTQSDKNATDKKQSKQAKAVEEVEPDSGNEKTTRSLPFTLDNVTLQVQPSELIAIVGSVGSGKTSLLSAIAGDMRQTSGLCEARGKRAFCAQVPWIQNATVRDNIVFGSDYDEDKYEAIVSACSLDHDLQVLPHGSSTEIGERGINLSGGQKHRISLARAIYFDADIVLLDDPLAAVDVHVGAHLMEHAICGLLKNKCRVLATHQLHFLPQCDRIVIMDKGSISAVDTFENLMENNVNFQQMMTSVSIQTKEQQKDEKPGSGENGTTKSVPEFQTRDVLIKEESRQTRGVSSAVYMDYWRSTGSLAIPPLVLAMLVIAQGANIMTNLWLAWWSGDKFGYSKGTYIGVYSAIGFFQAFLLFISALGFTIFGTRASKNMLRRAVQRVLRAPVSFFDTTPLGRITNRFSRDIDVMDNNLTESLRAASLTVSTVISIVILTIAYYYYFAVALVPLLVVYIVCAAYYRASAVEIKRHEAVLRSTVFSRFNEAIIGTSTIRAYGVQDAFAKKLSDSIDEMDSAYFLTFANQRWLGVRLDAIGVIFLIVTGMLVVTNQFTVSPSISGLVLSYLVSITQSLLLAVRQVSDSQNNMNSVERVHEYASSMPEEGPAETTELQLPASWPHQGSITFSDVQMRYRDGLPLVLQGFSLEVCAGERLGIVGRTGAGKSSIMAALFRIMELADGSISIDGLDISSIGLRDLRSRLSIIPQDPNLFRGTVRSNLDPFDEHTDLDLWAALRRAHLLENDNDRLKPGGDKNEEKSKERITLDAVVESDGSNFSLGQRQLMGLARALVRDSRIVVCDEATSSIDFESDRKVQETMAEGFKGKTVLCIAHRLKTIMGYNRICVIDKGRVAELASPLDLYDSGGIYRAMCERSQITREEIEMAQRDGAQWSAR